VTDGSSGDIYTFTSNGNQSTFASGLSYPVGLAFDSSGGLFESDHSSSNIYEFTPSGSRSTFASGLNWPLGLAFDGSGNLFVADNNTSNIYEYTPGSNRSTFASGLNGPDDVAFSTPEPSTIVLLGIGAVSLLAYACRKNRNRRIAWRAILTVDISCAVWLLAADTQAATLTFDDLSTPNAGTLVVPNGYGGFNWTYFGYLDPVKRYGAQDTGYSRGMVSSPQVAYWSGSIVGPAIISGPQFTFTSAYFTGAWNDGLNMQVAGYRGGVQVDSTAFTVNSTSSTLEVFNWVGVDELAISASGGVTHGYGGTGEQFVMDNMTINEVPEPSTSILLAIGAISFLAWRRRTRTA
jgi:hypothetical protein